MPEYQKTDEELWNATVSGDSKAFSTLYYRYWNKLYKTAMYHFADTNMAEQIVHDIFVVLWKRREHLHIDKFANYIRATARYHVYKALKAKKNSLIEYVDSYEDKENGKIYNTGEERLNYMDARNSLSKYIAPLPKRCREIFWLSRIENLSNDEIAEKFGISKRSVENQLTIALRHIRNANLDIASAAFVLALLASIV